MNEMNESPARSFRIYKTQQVEFGAFVCTKFIFQFDAVGKQIFVNMFCAFQGLCLFIAFFLDVAGICIVFAAKGVFLLLKALAKVLLKAFETIFKSVFGFCLKVLFVVFLILILVNKWQEVKEIIMNFHLFD